ncbi:MAG: DMT family transporter [Acetobacteraceae bacterium]|nr:DMT family transporter [Acetobacteraceae bacterium]
MKQPEEPDTAAPEPEPQPARRPARPSAAVRAGALLALLVVTAVWGTTFAMVKEALLSMPPFTFLAARFLLASALLMPVLPLARRGGGGRGGEGGPTANRSLARDLWEGVKAGVFVCLGYSFQTLGLRWTGAAEAAFITATSVVMVPALSPWLAGLRPSAPTWVGVATATSGLALLTLGEAAGVRGLGPGTAAGDALAHASAAASGPFGALTPLAGDLLVALCALAFALQILFVGRVAARCHPFPLALGQTLTVTVLCGLAAIGLERPLWGPPSPQAWAALGVTAVLATFLALVVQGAAQRVATPTEAALVFSTEPVFAAVFAWAYSGEALGPVGLVGAAFILAGTLIPELAPGRQRRAGGRKAPAGPGG